MKFTSTGGSFGAGAGGTAGEVPVAVAVQRGLPPEAPRLHDLVQSHGERLAAPLLAAAGVGYGEGVVLEVSGSGSDTQVVVSFAAAGSKRLLLAYAPLQKVEA